MEILLLQLKRIGDLLLTTPAIVAVREHFPAATISLVVAPGCRELLPAIAGVDRTLVAGPSAWWAIARRRFDCCIDFSHNDRSAFLALLSRARQRITAQYVQLQSKLRARSYNIFVDAPLHLLHTVDYHLALLRPLGIEHAGQRLQLRLTETARRNAERILSDAGIRGEFLLLHPGSARIEKFWVPERWSALVDFADARQLACVVTGASAPLEQAHIAEIQTSSRSPFVDLSGRLDLLTLAAIIERARLLVTVDSAPAHLAAALQTPQIALFGPTNPLHWRPRFSPALVLQAGNTTPSTEFFPDRPPVPMNQISTAQVIDGMEAILATPRDTPV
ncbi:MAG: putative lipopolysaccharide heptosyltransferase III [Chthoniobacterales bacterium]